ncbi:hypothetical protein TNCV_3101271 [Trichonephila clavipes]|nr:hypothetical protein TNCV_3101271 [Trichonephila clavipes]
MARKRAENREGSLGFPGFVKPVFTKDSKPLGRRKKITRAPRERETRTHLKKEHVLQTTNACVVKRVWPMRRRVNFDISSSHWHHRPCSYDRFHRVQFVIQLLTP